MKVTVTRRFTFSYAHSLIEHPKCGNIHGHNGVLEVEVSGQINEKTGMIIDFQDLNEVIVVRKILSILDHKNLNDLFTFPTTSENLVCFIWDKLVSLESNSIKFERVRLYETESCWAEIRND
uniref:Putative 6-Pyruvoyl tetrahydrobiopterin synthase n=1 Tax=viral metagenome TaxID=1070528 RepID=A0A6M3KZY1_9ZZZZ